MREIKFRSWNKKYKEMFYWDELLCKKEMSCIEGANKTIHHRYVSLFQHILTSNMGDGYELMQFTGLLDKNGKEIYEGDIVKIEDECYGVYRDEGYLEYFIMNGESNEPMYSYAHYEIVGNIYENPELINQ